jgi:ATP-binding cassette subfamily F protein 3
VKWGANISIGYYNQKLDEFNAENTVYDECLGDREANDRQLRDVLALMLFRNDDVEKPVGALSGGERARLRFAQLLLDKPNVLILDEPTNHLDIASSEALERALGDFPGSIICVSHDRYFLNQVAQRMLVLHPPGLIDMEGTYSDWAAKSKELIAKYEASKSPAKPQPKPQPAKKPEPKPQPSSQPAAKKKDNPYSRPFGKLTVQELEKQIAETEKLIADTQLKLADPANARDVDKLKQLQRDYDTAAAKLEQLEAEYYARET